MTYKSLLTVLCHSSDADGFLQSAIDFAAAHGAHLDVLCVGIDRMQTGYYFAGATALVYESITAQARATAEQIETGARAILEKSDISWGLEAVVAQPVGLTNLVARRARFSDLMILPKPYGPDRADDEPAVIEAALFQAHAGVLVIQPEVARVTAPRRILLAWNESDEALAAVRSALPLLIAAEMVDICIVAPRRHDADTTDPGSELCQMLARHGASAQVTILAQTLPRVSEVLARHATDTDAEMIVMGAYGHSRFREAILGGATRNLLEHAPVPVYLAH